MNTSSAGLTRHHACRSLSAWVARLYPAVHQRMSHARAACMSGSPALAFATLCMLALGGCDNAANGITEPALRADQGKRDPSVLTLTPYAYMNFAVWRVDCPYQGQYGPAGRGFKGTGYFPEDAMSDAKTAWDDINRAGYATTWMAVRRDWLSATVVDWARVDTEISFAVSVNASYISVDDVLSPYAWGGATIADATMLTFCHHVHLRGKKVAAADNDGMQAVLAGHPHFLDSVDVLMPYGYNRSLKRLQSYFNWIAVTFPGKAIVPILGYHVLDLVHPALAMPGQLGEQSGDAGFIELAQRYAVSNADPKARVVMYYYEPDSPWPSTFDARGGLKTYLDSLTSYLSRNRYIAPSAG